MGRQYLNPPLVEAVCEFRFLPDTQWDLTIPGLMYEKIQDRFPHKEQRLVSDIEISQEGKEIKQQVRTSERMWFLVEIGRASCRKSVDLGGRRIIKKKKERI